MGYRKVIIQRSVSPDGRVVAEARSEVITSEDQPDSPISATGGSANQVEQTVTVNVTSHGAFSRSSSVCSVNIHTAH